MVFCRTAASGGDPQKDRSGLNTAGQPCLERLGQIFTCIIGASASVRLKSLHLLTTNVHAQGQQRRHSNPPQSRTRVEDLNLQRTVLSPPISRTTETAESPMRRALHRMTRDQSQQSWQGIGERAAARAPRQGCFPPHPAACSAARLAGRRKVKRRWPHEPAWEDV